MPKRSVRESKVHRMAELRQLGDVMMSHIPLLGKELSAASGARVASSVQDDPATASIGSEEECTQEPVTVTLDQSREQPVEELIDARSRVPSDR